MSVIVPFIVIAAVIGVIAFIGDKLLKTYDEANRPGENAICAAIGVLLVGFFIWTLTWQ